MKIGVFDSGIGGLSVVHAIQKALPKHEVIFKNDEQHVPYGTRSVEELYGFTKPILQSLVDDGCKVIVIACNTVTTNFISRLRDELSVPLVGMEPMIKPAALATRTGIIAVCATPKTLSSKRYAWLKEQFAKGVKVLEPDCSDWTQMIENDRVDRERVAKIINDSCAAGADQIFLGCTHYHWIEEEIKELAKQRADVIQPEVTVISQLKRVTEQIS
jgi:glutamate racemase